jgi:hypothetical protein
MASFSFWWYSMRKTYVIHSCGGLTTRKQNSGAILHHILYDCSNIIQPTSTNYIKLSSVSYNLLDESPIVVSFIKWRTYHPVDQIFPELISWFPWKRNIWLVVFDAKECCCYKEATESRVHHLEGFTVATWLG